MDGRQPAYDHISWTYRRNSHVRSLAYSSAAKAASDELAFDPIGGRS